MLGWDDFAVIMTHIGAEQSAEFHPLIHLPKQSLMHTAVVRGKAYELAVIIIYAKALGQHFAHRLTTTAIPSCNCDHIVVFSHVISLLTHRGMLFSQNHHS